MLQYCRCVLIHHSLTGQVAALLATRPNGLVPFSFCFSLNWFFFRWRCYRWPVCARWRAAADAALQAIEDLSVGYTKSAKVFALAWSAFMLLLGFILMLMSVLGAWPRAFGSLFVRL